MVSGTYSNSEVLGLNFTLWIIEDSPAQATHFGLVPTADFKMSNLVGAVDRVSVQSGPRSAMSWKLKFDDDTWLPMKQDEHWPSCLTARSDYWHLAITLRLHSKVFFRRHR